MWRLAQFGVDELEEASSALRGAGEGAHTMEETADRVVRILHENLVDDTGGPATALVRFYKTHPFGSLPDATRAFAAGLGGDERLDDRTPCLTLIGTVGIEADWCDRHRSHGHQAIPLPSPQAVERLPMVSKMLSDLGLDTVALGDPSPAEALQLHHRTYDVFFVPDAAGSPWVPAQDFVHDYEIRSVVGIGGVLPSGDVFVVIMFTHVLLDEDVVDDLKSLAPAVKAAVIPTTFRVFA